MEKEVFYEWTEDMERLDEASAEQLKMVVDTYPYFQSARLLYTKNLSVFRNPLFDEELAKTAVLCGDRRKLFYLIRNEDYAPFLPARERGDTPEDKTQALLDSFLSSLDDEENTASQEPVSPELGIISTDYLSYLQSVEGEGEKEERKPEHPLKHQNIIDRFIEKAQDDNLFSNPSEPAESSTVNIDNEEYNDDLLTETLARIYIKQKKYEQALAIIRRLSLNFPKKSVYFADQIRFLEHLIINEKYKK